MINQGQVCGTGEWSGPLPGDPDDFGTLQAVPAFGGIDVSWTYPLTNPHAVAHTILYRGLSADFAFAVQHRVVSGDFYYDKTTASVDTLYYYWIRFVSIHGTQGSLIGPASATAKPTIASMIEMLTDKIDRGVLATALKEEIDKITFLEDGLTQETIYRQEDHATIVDSFTGLQASFDDTVSLVLEEVNLRSTADSSIASSVTTVQSQLGANLASVETTATTSINTLNGKVTDIGALYTVKVNVNGLAGGFGVYNDGAEVEAGFDVDRFWVGRTNANKRKPFIIQDDIVYIDTAAIRDASITNAKIENLNASKINAGYIAADRIQAGSITADKINGNGLEIRDIYGNLLLGSGSALNPAYAAAGTLNSELTPSIANAAATAVWSSVSGAGKPENNATVGAAFGVNLSGMITPANISTYIAGAAIGSAYIENAAITNAKIGNLEVSTLKIAGNAVSSMGGISGTTNQSFYLSNTVWSTIAITVYVAGRAWNAGGNTIGVSVDGVIRAYVLGQQYVESVTSAGESGTDTYNYAYTPETQVLLLGLDPGTHTITVTSPGRTYACVGVLTQR